MKSCAKARTSIAKPTNSIANGTDSNAKMMNSIANGTNSTVKATNSTANEMKSIAKTCNVADQLVIVTILLRQIIFRALCYNTALITIVTN